MSHWQFMAANDPCPKCPHAWHGLPCRRRPGVMCSCESSIPRPKEEEK